MLRECFRHLPQIERRRIAATPPDMMRLHRLERPEPWEEELRRLMFEGVPENLSNFYPDYAAFIARLAGFAGVGEEQLVVGQGIESLVRDLVMLTCDPGDVFAFTYPTCAMFPLYSEIFGAKPHPIAIGAEGIDSLALHFRVPAAAKLLLLPNPGQPVDTCFDVEDLAYLAENCRLNGTVLAVDEAYFGFGAPTALPLLEQFENVVVLRTFSKAFGGASLRIGYAIGNGDGDLIRALDACRQSGEVAGPSMHAAGVLMENFDAYVAPGIVAVCEGRDWLRKTLAGEGWNVRGRHANYVLIEVGDRATDIAAALEARNVRVRVNAPPVDEWLMVTCGSVGLMRRFHAAFSDVVSLH